MNNGMHIPFSISVFVFLMAMYSEAELLELAVLFLVFWGTAILFSAVAQEVTFLIVYGLKSKKVGVTQEGGCCAMF